jgi:predicted MarR family transcription regulator
MAMGGLILTAGTVRQVTTESKATSEDLCDSYHFIRAWVQYAWLLLLNC